MNGGPSDDDHDSDWTTALPMVATVSRSDESLLSANNTQEVEEEDTKEWTRGGMKVILPPPRMDNHPCPQQQQQQEQHHQKALHLLEFLGKDVLPKRSTQLFLDQWMEHWNGTTPESVRMIQANRYEIFCQPVHQQQSSSTLNNTNNTNKKNKTSTSQLIKDTACLDSLLRRHGLDPTDTKQCLMDYAQAQAHRDPRLTLDQYKFGNFSLILTYGTVEAQAPHIDVLYPNHQCGLLVTASPGTMWYPTLLGTSTTCPLSTIPQLLSAWERANAYDHGYYNHNTPTTTTTRTTNDDQDHENHQPQGRPGQGDFCPHPLERGVPPSLVQALYHSKDAQTLIRGYGTVLLPEEDFVQKKPTSNQHQNDNDDDHQTTNDSDAPAHSHAVVPGGNDEDRLSSYPVGTLFSLPGSMVHAGPASTEFRAVLFFSAWPRPSRNKSGASSSPHHQQPVHPRSEAEQENNNNNNNKDLPTTPETTSAPPVVAEYDPDTQYSSVFLCGRLVQLLWRQVGMDTAARRYLLYQLYRYIRRGGNAVTPKAVRTCRNWALHYTWDAFTAFVARMELDMSTRQQDWQLIEETARNELLCFYNVLGSRETSAVQSGLPPSPSQAGSSNTHKDQDGDHEQQPSGVPPLLCGDFVQVSVPHLHVYWPNDDDNDDQHSQPPETREDDPARYFLVQIFERPMDGKVLILYPVDPTQPKGFSWEGAEPEKHYTLVRPSTTTTTPAQPREDGPSSKVPSRQDAKEYWFDGTNATLLDSDGDPIQCVVRPPSTNKTSKQATKNNKSSILPHNKSKSKTSPMSKRPMDKNHKRATDQETQRLWKNTKKRKRKQGGDPTEGKPVDPIFSSSSSTSVEVQQLSNQSSDSNQDVHVVDEIQSHDEERNRSCNLPTNPVSSSQLSTQQDTMKATTQPLPLAHESVALQDDSDAMLTASSSFAIQSSSPQLSSSSGSVDTTSANVEDRSAVPCRRRRRPRLCISKSKLAAHRRLAKEQNKTKSSSRYEAALVEEEEEEEDGYEAS